MFGSVVIHSFITHVADLQSACVHRLCRALCTNLDAKDIPVMGWRGNDLADLLKAGYNCYQSLCNQAAAFPEEQLERVTVSAQGNVFLTRAVWPLSSSLFQLNSS